MQKINKLFQGIYELMKKPSLINHVIDNEEKWKKYVVKKYGLEKGLPTIPLSAITKQPEFSVDVYSFLGGGSMITDLALLRYLAQEKPQGSYLEIGSWRGESLANVAPFMKEAFSMNLSVEEMQSLGLSENYIQQHFILCKHLQNINYIRSNSLTYDWDMLTKKFDLIFVDGDHHFASVKSDTSNVFTKLKEDATIVWHDYAHTPENIRWEVLAAILDGTPVSCLSNVFHVENTLCAIYTTDVTLKHLHSKTPAEMTTFSVKVSLNK